MVYESPLAGDPHDESLDAEGAGELPPEELLAYVHEQCAKAAREAGRQDEVRRQREVIDAQCEESDALGLDSDEHNRRLVERQRASINIAARVFAPVALRLTVPVSSCSHHISTRGRGPRRVVGRTPRRVVRRTRTAARGDPDLPPELAAALPVGGVR